MLSCHADQVHTHVHITLTYLTKQNVHAHTYTHTYIMFMYTHVHTTCTHIMYTRDLYHRLPVHHHPLAHGMQINYQIIPCISGQQIHRIQKTRSMWKQILQASCRASLRTVSIYLKLLFHHKFFGDPCSNGDSCLSPFMITSNYFVCYVSELEFSRI